MLALCVFVLSACTSTDGLGSTGHEITESTPSLHDDGTVAAHGWARGPLVEYDRSLVQDDVIDGLREWEYYAVFTPDFAIGLTLSDIQLLAFGILTVEDYETGDIHDQILLGDAAALNFPPTPFENTSFESPSGSVEYRFEEGKRTIDVVAGAEGAPGRMVAHLELADSTTTESVAVVHHFDHPARFFYENKRIIMPATGSVAVGSKLYELPQGSSFGVLDWGRGAWPSDVRWEWGHFSGTLDGQTVGVNLGTVFADDSAGTADAVIVDGALHKIESSDWEYDLEDIMNEWHFTSPDGRLDLTLTPDFDDSTVLSLGMPLTLTRWKVHGEISGTVILDDGSGLDLSGIRGAAEYVEIVW